MKIYIYAILGLLLNHSYILGQDMRWSGDTLILSHVAYKSQKIGISSRVNMVDTIYLDLKSVGLEDVIVSTGYYNTLRNRSTGSFEHVNNELLNRSGATDIISRLEGLVPGLHFDKRNAGNRDATDGSYKLRLRGISTIYADSQPLIVLDNYPFEGDIRTINPNDIQSITILRDAAAASIWGAKAANGVIVITSKSGNYSSPMSVSFNSNFTASSLPDLSYMSSFIDAGSFIELEKYFFSKGFYTSRENNQNKPVLSPVVEALIAHRDGTLSQQVLDQYLGKLASNNLLDQASKYLYGRSVNQQYSLSLSGGGEKANYHISTGYDHNRSWNKGNGFERISINIRNQFKPIKSLEIRTDISFTNSKNTNNAVDLRNEPWAFPYQTLVDEGGNPQAFPRDYRISFVDQAQASGLLEWNYLPLEELHLNNAAVRGYDARIGTSVRYSFSEKVNLDVGYQYHHVFTNDRTLRDRNSYFVRNLVNRFTQTDGRKIFPEGDILTFANSLLKHQTARAQLNYFGDIAGRDNLSLLVGTEIRERKQDGEGSSFYGYNDDVLTIRPSLDYQTFHPVRPFSLAALPIPPYNLSSTINRYLSYYGNASYNMRSRYIFSTSVRWDASNLFGVKTNQKGVPLWSVGGSWKLSDEKFYNLSILPVLNLRLTYGYGGNIDNSSTAYTTIVYRSQVNTNMPFGEISSPGNRNLRWEKVNTVNLGLDLGTKSQWLSGYLEVYQKRSTDMVGLLLVDPTIYTESNNRSAVRVNYADMTTKGIDMSLRTKDIGRSVKLNTNLFLSYAANKVNTYKGGNITTSTAGYTRGMVPLPIEGRSIDALYSLPWAGLDPINGDPLVGNDAELHKNYTSYLNAFPISELIDHGSSVPLVHASLRNTIGYKGFTVSANITYKGIYYFRRPTIMYGTIVASNQGIHRDYALRWKIPGDEVNTQVPSLPNSNVANRDIVYSQSEILVSKGDHIRLDDIYVTYLFKQRPGISLYGHFNNLGILWKAEKTKVDPDYPSANILSPRTFLLGIKLSF